MRKPDWDGGSIGSSVKAWALGGVQAAQTWLARAWERLAVALHLRKPPRRGLRGRLLHRH